MATTAQNPLFFQKEIFQKEIFTSQDLKSPNFEKIAVFKAVVAILQNFL